MIKTTFEKLSEIDNTVGNLYKKDPTLKESKFGYAYNRFHKKNYEKTLTQMREELGDFYIDNALEDEKTKAILRDEKSITGYAHNKEQLKAILKKQKEIVEKYNPTIIEVEPYIASYIPEMNEEQKEILTGYLI